MKKRVCLLLACTVLATLTVGFLAGQERAGGGSSCADAADTKHKDDEEAVRKLSAELTRALEKGDAKALAALWTEEGEYVSDDGTTVRGRAALEAAYAIFFAKSGGVKADIAIDTIRFLSKDSAVEEGIAKLRKTKGNERVVSRYSTLCVREDGRWRIALLREWPEEGVMLRDLDWLVGTWTAKTAQGEVRTTYEWDEDKVFLRGRIIMKEEGRTMTATQRIARDPRTGGLRSWIFGKDGGFAEAAWSRDGKRWLLEATGVQSDGEEMTATNVLTPLDKDSFTWQSIDRTDDGKEQPNLPPIKVTRVK